MSVNLEDVLRAYREGHTALHELWTAQVGTPGYDKAKWRVLSNAFDKLGRDAATLAGYPRKEPLL